MKIRVALLDDDKNYLNRVTSVFTNKFSEKMEVRSFSNKDVAMSEVYENKIDVLVASDAFDIDSKSFPSHCGFAYFTSSSEVSSLRGEKTICRFQKAEMIYKAILGIFSEHITDIGIKFSGDADSRVYTFTSASGGAGASTLAAAYAKRVASTGKKIIYLNLEKLGNTDLYFSGEGRFDFSDVIFSLKSKKANLVLKMESYVKQDSSGVDFYSSSKNALDAAELTKDDIQRLIMAIKTMKTYEYIVADINFTISPAVIELFRLSDKVIFISDGSYVANEKFTRAYGALEIYEKQQNLRILSNVNIIYNKFRSKTGKIISDSGIMNLGGIPKIENANREQILDYVMKSEVIDKLA